MNLRIFPWITARHGFITKACSDLSPLNLAFAGATWAVRWQEAQERIAEHVKLPSGYRLVWAGEFEDLWTREETLEVIVLVSLVLVAGSLYSLFNNVHDCFWHCPESPLRLSEASSAVLYRAAFQHFRRDRFRLPFRRFGDVRHFDDHLLLP